MILHHLLLYCTHVFRNGRFWLDSIDREKCFKNTRKYQENTKKAVPSEILEKEIHIPDSKISLVKPVGTPT